MKIVLVNSSIDRTLAMGVDDGRPKEMNLVMGRDPPLGLCYMAQVLRDDGYSDVEIMDAQVEDLPAEEMAARILSKNPDVVGISVISFSFLYGAELASAIKKASSVPIVVGGVHVDLYPEDVMSHAFFDVGVVGEGERTFSKLVKLIDRNAHEGKKLLGGVERIENLVFVRKGVVVKTERAGALADLDSLPFPAIDLLDLEKYYLDFLPNPSVALISARGCPFSCSYCSKTDWSRVCRFHSPAYIVKEMESCIKRFGARSFQFLDDTFTVDRRRVLEMCRLMKERGIDVELSCLTRVDTVDEEMLRALKDAGLRSISFGVESGDQRILDRMNKRVTVAQIRDAFALCRRLGIKTTAFFMIGHPDETLESVDSTMRLVREISPNWFKTNILTTYPGSPMYDELVRSGKIGDYWREMTADLRPRRTPEICAAIGRRELKAMQNRINMMPYLRPSYLASAFSARPKQVYRNLKWMSQILYSIIGERD